MLLYNETAYIFAGKPIKGLPPQISIQSSDSGASLHYVLAQVVGCSIHRLRISLSSDGSQVIENSDSTLESAGLTSGIQVFIKDLGMRHHIQSSQLVDITSLPTSSS